MTPGLPSYEARMFHSRLRQAAWEKTTYHPMNQTSPSEPEIKAKARVGERSDEGGGSRLLREKASSLCLSNRKGDTDDWGGVIMYLTPTGVRS